ncbi:hypothetical protein [Mucilaginibacter polytrichastri]|uniref:Uncharacterized protein n=1 Tax=Mucilaginibacter polytrichastri TaxID=1302689 RepID=A0A1Q5ZW43_9SPHI|nr:hypothetical protein [Mucilaginibacter polytrichastri]OKS85960.1 hypothetical protein RG47T_1407 [Mucilaginibacter polytrichastri]SFS60214.1 hypothetical protein SAMN04487890_102177 [Mucilaginibacter polytrichastri]
MKQIRNILTICILPITLVAAAQTTTTRKVEKVNIDKSIDDNGKELHIKISGTKGNKPIIFDRLYNIKGMSKPQVEAVKKHVLDSLGVN